MSEIEAGADVTLVEIDPEGAVTTSRTDDSEQLTPEQDDLRGRIRAQSFSAHQFLKRKRRLWPIPRI